MTNNDNELLVEFEFIIDLDMAMYKYIQKNYASSEYVDQQLIYSKNEYAIINLMMHRINMNPLRVLMPNVDPDKLYNEIIDNSENEVLKYAKPYDSFYLIITYIIQASSVGVTILCNNQIEADFIKSKDSRVNTLICEDKSKLDLKKYTALYVKYFHNLIKYGNIEGKYIYISSARYNYDKNNKLDESLILLYGDLNIIKFMDLYTQIKYHRKKGESKNDLLEYSTADEGEEDSKGDSWYNLRFPK